MKKLTKLLSVLSAGVLAVCAVPVSAFAEDKDHYPTDEEWIEKRYAPEYALGEDLSLYSLGDVDMDGEVTAYDARMILTQFCFSMIDLPDILTEDQLKLANVDGKSSQDYSNPERWFSVDPYDATLALRYAALRCAGYEFSMEEFLAETLK